MDQKVVEKALKEFQVKLEEIKAIYSELQTLKKYGAEINLPDLQSIFSSDKSETGFSVDISIRPDEFYGMAHNVAAEKYLKKVGHAASFDDIYNALSEGGIKFTANGRTVLNKQLTRGTRKFVKMGEGHKISFGLLEFYPERVSKMQQRTAEIAAENNTAPKTLQPNYNEEDDNVTEETTDLEPF